MFQELTQLDACFSTRWEFDEDYAPNSIGLSGCRWCHGTVSNDLSASLHSFDPLTFPRGSPELTAGGFGGTGRYATHLTGRVLQGLQR